MTITNEYIGYITLQGDTWDFIAWSFYGNELLMNILIEANPHIPITPVLEMAQTLAIPVITDIRPRLTNEQRPPWRAK